MWPAISIIITLQLCVIIVAYAIKMFRKSDTNSSVVEDFQYSEPQQCDCEGCPIEQMVRLRFDEKEFERDGINRKGLLIREQQQESSPMMAGNSSSEKSESSSCPSGCETCLATDDEAGKSEMNAADQMKGRNWSISSISLLSDDSVVELPQSPNEQQIRHLRPWNSEMRDQDRLAYVQRWINQTSCGKRMRSPSPPPSTSNLSTPLDKRPRIEKKNPQNIVRVELQRQISKTSRSKPANTTARKSASGITKKLKQSQLLLNEGLNLNGYKADLDEKEEEINGNAIEVTRSDRNPKQFLDNNIPNKKIKLMTSSESKEKVMETEKRKLEINGERVENEKKIRKTSTF